jgi:phosphatidylglycerol:prolipoprotein diacylglycerol transferase
MQQVLFRIPGLGIPIYGFGVMLFCTFIACIWVASRRARLVGINPIHIQDLAVWIFVGGILGARVVFMIQYHEDPWNFFKIWQGGLVFYGSAIGGVIGYALAYYFVIRKQGLSTWKLADVIAPAAAVGLCLGRVGCLLNGCCYGNVACSHCPALHFYLSSPPRYSLVKTGLQTPAGFTLAEGRGPAIVADVEPHSPAEEAGLHAGDDIVNADGQVITSANDLWRYMLEDWPRGKKDLALTVRRAGNEIALPAFVPRTLGLHPTQVYESISMVLLLLVLLAYFPLRRHDGELMVLFILGYSVHRFLNEMLRNDTDPVLGNLTLSQVGSIFFLVVGLGLAIWLWRQPAQYYPATEAGH